MFIISYRTFGGVSKSISVIDEQYAYFMFNALLTAVDCEAVHVVDGFTGEIIISWDKGKFDVINRCAL